jgi:hypothetical protein
MHVIFKNLFWLTVFCIAMGFLETAVVVYLRKLYYPGGFHFPLAAIPPDVARIEILREAATLVMLAGVSILSARERAQRFAFFVYAFAIWDLFYYVFLKVLLDWPDSFQTWDILFLLPVPWVGPVLAPCIVSGSMILITLLVLSYAAKGYDTRFRFIEWMLMGIGSFIMIWSFCEDYLHLVVFGNKPFWALSGDRKLFSDLEHYVPLHFNWSLFFTGEVILLLAVLFYGIRLRKSRFVDSRLSGWFSEYI